MPSESVKALAEKIADALLPHETEGRRRFGAQALVLPLLHADRERMSAYILAAERDVDMLQDALAAARAEIERLQTVSSDLHAENRQLGGQLINTRTRLEDRTRERDAVLAKLGRLDWHYMDLDKQALDATAKLEEARGLMARISGWDHMDTAADGAYWREEIRAFLAAPPAPTAEPLRIWAWDDPADPPAPTAEPPERICADCKAAPADPGVTVCTPCWDRQGVQGQAHRRAARGELPQPLSPRERGEHCAPPAPTVSEEPWKQYRRKQIAELRPYVVGENLSWGKVSISAPDLDAGSPKPGDMIARNPKNHDDQWLVAAAYFADNFEPMSATVSEETPRERHDFDEWHGLGYCENCGKPESDPIHAPAPEPQPPCPVCGAFIRCECPPLAPEVSKGETLAKAGRLATLVRQAWDRNDALAMKLFGGNLVQMLANDVERDSPLHVCTDLCMGEECVGDPPAPEPPKVETPPMPLHSLPCRQCGLRVDVRWNGVSCPYCGLFTGAETRAIPPKPDEGPEPQRDAIEAARCAVGAGQHASCALPAEPDEGPEPPPAPDKGKPAPDPAE